MPKKSRANYFNFSGGLNTDASPLNRSPITVTDIDNCTLNIDGSIESRKGIELFSNTLESMGQFYEDYVQVKNWNFRDNTGTLGQVQVAQIDGRVQIFLGDASGFSGTPTDAATYPTVFEIDSYYDILTEGNKLYPLRKGSGNCMIDAYSCNYLGILSSIGSYTFKFREYTTVAASHTVDVYWTASAATINLHPAQDYSGVVWTPIGLTTGAPEFAWDTSYASGANVKMTKGVVTIPTTTVTWQVGSPVKLINSDGDISYDTVRSYKTYATFSEIILDGLIDTTGVVSLTTTQLVDLPGRIPLGELALGRVFISEENSANRIYFSQIYSEDTANIAKMYTEASPIDPIDSSVVASDGGFFDVKGVTHIVGIKENNGSIIIFAENGVWEASGTDGIFRADDFVLRQITNVGCVSKASISRVENGIVYASEQGIHMIGPNESTGISSISTSLTENKIHNLYVDIPRINKKRIQISYNYVDKELYCLYNEGANPNDYIAYKDILIYSFKLSAWYKWSLPSDPTFTDISIGHIYMSEYNSVITPIAVMTNWGTGFSLTGSALLYGTEESDFFGSDYESPIDVTMSSAHQSYGDLMRGKMNNYIKILYEDLGSVGTDDNGYDNILGGCKLRSSVDFADSAEEATDAFGETKLTNVGYGIPYEIYPSEKAGYSHLMYKHKLLGRGNVLQYNFSNYHIEGYYRCIADSTGDSPVLDIAGSALYWEEIDEATYTGSLWDIATAYTVGDTVKTSKPTQFKIIGWSSEMIPTESITTS